MKTVKINADNFETIQDLINLYDENYYGKHINIEVDNGCKIEMKRKFSYFSGSKVVKTNYAHIIMLYPNGTQCCIKEKKDGTFETSTSPYKWQQIIDFRI